MTLTVSIRPGCKDVHQGEAEPGPGQDPEGGLLHPEGVGVPEAAPQVGEPRHGPGRLAPEFAAVQQAHGLDDFAHLGPGVGPGEVGEDRVEDQLGIREAGGQGVLPEFQGQGDFAFEGGGGKGPGVQEQEHQVGAGAPRPGAGSPGVFPPPGCRR